MPRIYGRRVFVATKNAIRPMKYLLVFVLLVYGTATVGRMYARKYYIFLPSYAQWLATPGATVGARSAMDVAITMNATTRVQRQLF